MTSARVVPAQAGTQRLASLQPAPLTRHWVPACAGTTNNNTAAPGSRA